MPHVTSPIDVERRREFLGLDTGAAAILARVGRELEPHLPAIIDRFYRNLARFPETSQHLTDPMLVRRLGARQLDSFRRLLSGDLGPGLFAERTRLGEAHSRIGLGPEWFVGGYALLLEMLAHELVRDRDEAAGVGVLLKLALLDVGLSLEAYFEARRREVASAEQRAHRSEASFRRMIDHLPDAVAVQREETFIFANGAMAQLLGYEHADQVVGTSVAEALHPEDVAISREYADAAEQSPLPLPPRELRVRRRDGAIVHAEVITLRHDFEGRPAVLTVARDLTERREMELRLRHADRMVSVGTLAAGVAHEINNPLSYVIANLDYAREVVASSADAVQACQALDDARLGADRVRAIVTDLRAFSRADHGETRHAVLARVAEQAIAMTQHEIRQRAQLVRDFGPAPAVAAQPAQLGQVILNLLVNAAQAIPEGQAGAHEIRVRIGTAPDGRGKLEVIDSGHGIAPELKRRIFDPFFTTKPVGKGTGLGLSICHGIVAGCGGEIEVDSVPGAGSTFRVLLPPAEVSDATPSAQAGPLAGSFSGRVLVIDDEPLLGALVGRLLPDAHVVTVTSGVEAVALLERDRNFDALLCDLIMPDITGPDLLQQLERQDPALSSRAVVMTGGAFTERAETFLRTTRLPVILKPFGQAELLAALGARLAGSAVPP